MPLPERLPPIAVPPLATERWLGAGAWPQAFAEEKDLVREAEAYLDHLWLFFGLSVQEKEIDWHRDPVSGLAPPRTVRGKDIDYRDPGRIGDVKRIWEKNRHHHLTVMALVYWLTGDERFSKETVTQLSSWLDQNPYPYGINWNQALEAGIRLIAWVWIERLLRGSVHHQVFFGSHRFWEAVYRHQQFIEKERSFGSSANNHLIGEMAGLLVAATAWSHLPAAGRWRRIAQQALEEEILRQTFPSGLSREQAFEYHLFVTELLLLSLLEGDRRGEPFSETYRHRLRRMIEVIPQLLDVGGNLPRYGDGDGGKALQLQPMASPRLNWLLQVGRTRLQARVPSALLPGAYDQGKLACWLLTGETRSLAGEASEEVPIPGSVAFADAGIYVLAARRGTPDEIFVLADAGELGYLSTAAHGHADALSFTFSVGGVPIIVDPGTYTYYDPDPFWRAYFRGTAAHNTVVVDGKDQSQAAGPFLWTRKARAWVEEWENGEEGAHLLAAHDGYSPLGVIHRRELTLSGRSLLIVDRLEGSGSHEIALRFHLAPGAALRYLGDQTWEITRFKRRVLLRLPASLQVQVFYGQREGGWFSPSFGEKEPSYTVEGRATLQLPVKMESTLEVVP